jgi:hypothetical protein
MRLSQGRQVPREQVPISEPGKRQVRGLVFRRPTGYQFPPMVLEMLREFLDDLVLASRRQAQRRQP